MTTQTETTKERQIPDFYIFSPVEIDGQQHNIRVGAAFAHKKGKGYTFLISSKRYVAFPPKAKTPASAATGEEGA